jgi:endo-1,4-beta-xylanase
MTDPVKSHVTRRQFGRAALGVGATAALGAGAGACWFHAKKQHLLEAAIQPAVTGSNSLQAHAAARGLFYGAGVRTSKLDVEGFAMGHSTDGYTQLVAAQAGMLEDEYTMNWKWLRPAPGRFDFTQADRLLRFASLTGKTVRGPLLCWHEALPDWFKSTAAKENARQLLTEHIHTVVSRLRGQIHCWTAVNEAIEPADGRPDGLRKSPWLELIGPHYIEVAFRAANEADPQATLVYNDFGFEMDRGPDVKKREQVLELLQRLKSRGIPVHAVGVQSHLYAAGHLFGAGLQSFIREAAKMGLEVHISELDVNCRGLKGEQGERDAAIARVYREYLNLVLAEPNVPLVITWGITDANSWLREYWLFSSADRRRLWTKLAESRRQRPLPFDDDFNPTPAFWALRDAFDAAPLRGRNRTSSVPVSPTGE